MTNAEDGEPEVDSSYLALFQEHVEDFRNHLSGRVEGEALRASYCPPNAHWSATEKDALFHALSVHSRLRPDLIAEEVQTKTISDVCAYISMMEEADCSLRKLDKVGHIDLPPLLRKDFPAAVEVPEDWVIFEENCAATMVSLQPLLDLEDTAREREEVVQTHRTAIRAPKLGARTVEDERDRAGEKGRREEFERWLEQQQADWEGEDLLLSLDKKGLTALDRILRADEEGRGMVAQQPHASEEPTQDAPPADVVPPLVPASAPIPTTDDDLIDPALLGISHSVLTPFPDVAALPDHTHAATVPASTPAPLPEHGLFPPLVLNTSLNPDSEAGSSAGRNEEDVSQMSPTSRRRFQKRLHMRRKRAQAAGKVVDENIGRLKPGRKPKKPVPRAQSAALAAEIIDKSVVPSAPPAGSTPSTQGLAQEADALGSDDEFHDKSDYRHAHPSGQTLPYKRQQQFLSKGVDAQRLRREGLALFHLQGISKLMGTYNQLYGVPESVASKISGETLRLLHGLVVNFVAQVMSRAITWREQERLAKLQSKVWRFKETRDISAPNVRHALALYGADSLGKRTHFGKLLKDFDYSSDECDNDVDNGNGDDAGRSLAPSTRCARGRATSPEAEAVPGSRAESSTLPLEPLPLLRSVFPPFFHLPSAASASTEAAYMPWPSSSLLATGAEPPREEELLPDEYDSGAEEAEVLEDDVLDRADQAAEKQALEALWARVGRSGNEDEGDGASKKKGKEKAQAAPCRKRKAQEESSRESANEGGSDEEAGEGEDADAEADTGRGKRKGAKAGTGARARGRPRKRRKTTKFLTQDQLMFVEPGRDSRSRIKSSVYVHSSADESE